MRDRISIAMTTYNGGRFIREQLDSLYCQTRVPDEIVVCDDGSTDNTIEILEEYHQRYGLKYFVNKPNIGVNENFLRVFSKCTGDYVFICDQDDIWFHDKIAKHYEEMCKTDRNIPVVVASSIVDIDAKGNPIAEPFVEPFSDKWETTLISTNHSQGCTMLMNRCLVNKVLELHDSKSETHSMMYDVLVSVTAAACGKKINMGIPLMYYRHHDANVIGKFQAHGKTFCQKVHDMPLYYPFLMDYRIKELALSDSMLSEEEMKPEIRAFLKKMSRLYKTKNIITGIGIILLLPNINLKRKLKISILTPIVFLLKRLL